MKKFTRAALAGAAGTTAPASSVLEHAAVLGAATGMRSTVALAALVLRRSDGLPAALRHPAARWIAAAGDGAELVVDKFPGTPSRLDPPGLTGRLISAAWPPRSSRVLSTGARSRPC